MDKLAKMPYTEIKEAGVYSLEGLLYILVCERKWRDELYTKDRVMEKVNKKIIDLNSDFMDGLYYDHDEFLDRLRCHIVAEEKQIEFASKLLKMNKNTKEEIVLLTGLSLEDVEELAKELEQENKNE